MPWYLIYNLASVELKLSFLDANVLRIDKTMIKTKNATLQRCRITKTQVQYDYYKLQQKQAYFRYRCTATNHSRGAIWKDLNKLNIGKVRAEGVPEIFNDANVINNYFAISATSPVNVAGSDLDTGECCDKFTFRKLSPLDLLNILRKTKTYCVRCRRCGYADVKNLRNATSGLYCAQLQCLY